MLALLWLQVKRYAAINVVTSYQMMRWQWFVVSNQAIHWFRVTVHYRQPGMSCYIFLCRWSCYMLWRHNAQLTTRGTRTFWAYVLMFADTDKVRWGALPQWLYTLTRILLTFLHLAPNTKTYQHSWHASQVGKVQSIIFQSNWYVVDTLNLLTVICVSLF